MKRFVIDATCYHPDALTGAGRLVYHLVDNLAAIDRENAYLVFGFAERFRPGLPENFRYQRIRPWGLLGPVAQEAARRSFLRKRVAHFKTDLVHCTLEMTPLYDEHTRVLFSLYDLARRNLQFSETVGRDLRTVLRTRLRYSSAKKADMIHTISHFSAELIHRRLHIDPARIRVIYPGVDPRFTPGPSDSSVLTRHGLHDGRYLLFVGEFGRQKNEEGLIKAFLSACNDRALPDGMQLALVGDPANLSDTARTLLDDPAGSGVKMLGRVSDDDLLHLYRGARALVLPSFDEGFGLPPAEAMACGTVPIVSNATSLPEVVGDAGLVVKPDKQAELTDAIVRVTNDDTLHEQLQARGRKRAERFSFSAMTRQLHALYCEMTDG